MRDELIDAEIGFPPEELDRYRGGRYSGCARPTPAPARGLDEPLFMP
jgi:hypothetical protein